tara:strand:+ start:476 stop:754 length:279 start_codon:yes stop_codon:yes gene_type:complete
MKNNKVFVLGSLLISAAITYYFFMGFGFCDSGVDVFLYDGVALIIGFLLIFSSYYLLKKGPGHKYSHFLGIIIGLAMIITHGVKLFLGKCFF